MSDIKKKPKEANSGHSENSFASGESVDEKQVINDLAREIDGLLFEIPRFLFETDSSADVTDKYSNELLILTIRWLGGVRLKPSGFEPWKIPDRTRNLTIDVATEIARIAGEIVELRPSLPSAADTFATLRSMESLVERLQKSDGEDDCLSFRWVFAEKITDNADIASLVEVSLNPDDESAGNVLVRILPKAGGTPAEAQQEVIRWLQQSAESTEVPNSEVYHVAKIHICATSTILAILERIINRAEVSDDLYEINVAFKNSGETLAEFLATALPAKLNNGIELYGRLMAKSLDELEAECEKRARRLFEENQQVSLDLDLLNESAGNAAASEPDIRQSQPMSDADECFDIISEAYDGFVQQPMRKRIELSKIREPESPVNMFTVLRLPLRHICDSIPDFDFERQRQVSTWTGTVTFAQGPHSGFFLRFRLFPKEIPESWQWHRDSIKLFVQLLVSRTSGHPFLRVIPMELEGPLALVKSAVELERISVNASFTEALAIACKCFVETVKSSDANCLIYSLSTMEEFEKIADANLTEKKFPFKDFKRLQMLCWILLWVQLDNSLLLCIGVTVTVSRQGIVNDPLQFVVDLLRQIFWVPRTIKRVYEICRKRQFGKRLFELIDSFARLGLLSIMAILCWDGTHIEIIATFYFVHVFEECVRRFGFRHGTSWFTITSAAILLLMGPTFVIPEFRVSVGFSSHFLISLMAVKLMYKTFGRQLVAFAMYMLPLIGLLFLENIPSIASDTPKYQIGLIGMYVSVTLTAVLAGAAYMSRLRAERSDKLQICLCFISATRFGLNVVALYAARLAQGPAVPQTFGYVADNLLLCVLLNALLSINEIAARVYVIALGLSQHKTIEGVRGSDDNIVGRLQRTA